MCSYLCVCERERWGIERGERKRSEEHMKENKIAEILLLPSLLLLIIIHLDESKVFLSLVLVSLLVCLQND